MTYGMVIDLKKCIGCKACVTACKEANGTPPGVLRSRVVREDSGTYPNVKRSTVPLLCMQCENAPCVEVCPSGATAKGEDGIVTIDKEKCIGCDACVTACPYQARGIRKEEGGYFGQELSAYEAVMYKLHPVNTADKCDFCKGSGKLEAGEPQACVAACMANARIFGELDELKAKFGADAYQLLPEQGTNPSVWYLPDTVNEA